MFPISDDNSDRIITPYVNYAFIAINILVFVFLQGLGGNEHFTYAFSLVPREITTGIDLTGMQIVHSSLNGQTVQIPNYSAPLGVYFNLLSSMFMHGGISHIFGNMLFLWIFGDNIENLIGHVRYAIFYVVCGFAAAFGQILMRPDSIIPMLGASGAISGVLGGYMLLFPTREFVHFCLIFIRPFRRMLRSACGSAIKFCRVILSPAGEGGVAYAAHIGGFIAGLALIKVFAIGKNIPAKNVILTRRKFVFLQQIAIICNYENLRCQRSDQRTNAGLRRRSESRNHDRARDRGRRARQCFKSLSRSAYGDAR